MTAIRVLGIDPGFANIGICIVDLYSIGSSSVVATDIINTKPTRGKSRTLDDELRRLESIEDRISLFIDDHSPHVLAMEEPGKCLMRRKNHTTKKMEWATNAALLRTSCLMWGAAHGICRSQGIYCIKIGSQEIKKSLTNKRSASKQEIIDAVKNKYPNYNNWPEGKKIEHAADAVGAAVTSFTDPTVMVMLKKFAQK